MLAGDSRSYRGGGSLHIGECWGQDLRLERSDTIACLKKWGLSQKPWGRTLHMS